MGDSSLYFQISVFNTSNETGNPNHPTIPVNLTEVGLTPSCAAFGGTGACTTPELDVFDIKTGTAAATGIDGACVGTAFTVSERDGTGRHTITPDAPAVLGPSDGSGGPTFCTLEGTIKEAVRFPTTDIQPAQEGRPDAAQCGRTNSGPGLGPRPKPGTERDGDGLPEPGDTFYGVRPQRLCRHRPGSSGQRGNRHSDRNLYNWVATFEPGDNNYGSIPDRSAAMRIKRGSWLRRHPPSR